MLRQKGLAPILIIVLIAAAIGGYLIYSGKINLPQKQVTQTSKSDVNPAVTGDEETVYTESDRSANWKTYTNNKYNYSIFYPKDAQVIPEGDFKIFIKGKNYPYGTYVTVDILDNPKGLILSQLGSEEYATDAPSPYDLPWQKTKFLGMDVLTTKYRPPGDSGKMTIYLFEKEGIIYSLWKAPVDEPNSTYFNDLADSIISTFKFTK